MAVFNYRQRNNIVLVILIVLACFILYSLRTIAGAVLGTVIMYTIFRPVYLFLTRKHHWNKVFAALLIILGSFTIIVLPIMEVTALFIDKLREFKSDPVQVHAVIDKITEFVGKKLNLPDLLPRIVQKGTDYLSELFPSLLSGAASIILEVAVAYFLLYFMLTRHEDFEKGLLHYSPFREQNARKFAEELKNLTYANILGQGFIAVVQGALVTIGFYIFHVPDGIFWGFIATFLSFLPVIGAPVVFVPAALLKIINGHGFDGYGLLIWGLLLITNIDNVIRTILSKRLGNTHPIITVIGVIIGIPVFGIMGLVFGPLLLSYFILTVKIYEASRLASEKIERIRSFEEE